MDIKEKKDLNKENNKTITPNEITIAFRQYAESKGYDLEKIKEIIDKFKRAMVYFKCAILEIETKFNVLNEEFSLKSERNPITAIQSRLKSPESIMEKVQRKNIPFDFEEIIKQMHDIAGVRCVCSFIDDVYFMAQCICSQDDIRVIEIKDYIKNPKPNGYRSLHIIVEIPIFLENGKKEMKVEIQLRTIAMEFWANLEHKLRYKKNLDSEMIKETSKELKECAIISAQLDERMQNARDKIDEIE